MANSSTLQPFGFSRRTRIVPQSSRSSESVTSLANSDRSSSRRSSRHISPHNDSCWPLPPPSYTRMQPTTSSVTPFPDEEEYETIPSMSSNRRSPVHKKRRPPRLQTTHLTPTPSVTSPITPTTTNVLAQRTPPTEKQLKQQLRNVYSALSQTEADRERIMRQSVAGKTDQRRIERELETLKQENRRLANRLEELLKSPASARGDDVWGSSMYMDTDGH